MDILYNSNGAYDSRYALSSAVHSRSDTQKMNILNEKRIGDTDREQYFTHLNECYARGFLTHEEYETRTCAVSKAKTSLELMAIAHDLPDFPVPHDSRSWRHRNSTFGIVVPHLLAIVLFTAVMTVGFGMIGNADERGVAIGLISFGIISVVINFIAFVARMSNHQ